jgi:hypothetical protein
MTGAKTESESPDKKHYEVVVLFDLPNGVRHFARSDVTEFEFTLCRQRAARGKGELSGLGIWMVWEDLAKGKGNRDPDVVRTAMTLVAPEVTLAPETRAVVCYVAPDPKGHPGHCSFTFDRSIGQEIEGEFLAEVVAVIRERAYPLPKTPLPSLGQDLGTLRDRKTIAPVSVLHGEGYFCPSPRKGKIGEWDRREFGGGVAFEPANRSAAGRS